MDSFLKAMIAIRPGPLGHHRRCGDRHDLLRQPDGHLCRDRARRPGAHLQRPRRPRLANGAALMRIDSEALGFGLLVAFIVGQMLYPLVVLRSAPPTPPGPEPTPPADPQKDPGWCHSHGKHRSEEEAEGS